MEQSLQQVLFIPEVMSAAEFGRLENARRCGVRHHTFESVQVREPDSIAIDKKGLAGRMHGTVVSTVDAVWKYFEVLKQALRTGRDGGEAKQKGENGELVGAGGPDPVTQGQDWLAWLGRFEALLAGQVLGPAGAGRASWVKFGGSSG